MHGSVTGTGRLEQQVCFIISLLAVIGAVFIRCRFGDHIRLYTEHISHILYNFLAVTNDNAHLAKLCKLIFHMRYTVPASFIAFRTSSATFRVSSISASV